MSKLFSGDFNSLIFVLTGLIVAHFVRLSTALSSRSTCPGWPRPRTATVRESDFIQPFEHSAPSDCCFCLTIYLLSYVLSYLLPTTTTLNSWFCVINTYCQLCTRPHNSDIALLMALHMTLIMLSACHIQSSSLLVSRETENVSCNLLQQFSNTNICNFK